MPRFIWKITFLLGILSILTVWCQAEIPQAIRYQGHLVEGTSAVDGTVAMVLRLYDAPTGGSVLCADSNAVTVTEGLYATTIGDNMTTGTISEALGVGTVYIEVEVNGTKLTPRHQLTSVAYALQSGPVGQISMFGGTNAPPGWLLCDGSAVSRTDYAALFGVIGINYGVGDSITSFNLPDLRQRFPLGQAPSGTGDGIGDTGGTIDHSHIGGLHSHSVSNHSHTVSFSTDGGHSHSVDGDSSTQIYVSSGGSYAISKANHIHDSADYHSHYGSSGLKYGLGTMLAGAGPSDPANPPYQVVNFIIKY